MSARPALGAWLRFAGGAAILIVLALELGAEPFVQGLRRTDAVAVLVALMVTAITTALCAWRWSVLSERLDVAVPVGTAYRRYYRSQLLNATLPTGVLGDLHRGLDHGRRAGALGRGVRSVVWDRVSGQLVQATMALAAVPLLPGLALDARWTVPVAALGAVALVAAFGGRVVLASALAAAGHVVVFVVAARSVGVAVPLAELAALALVVLLASALPLSLAGWGPREGAAAWLFAEAGLGAAAGVSVAVAFGIVSLVATLPGVLALTPERTEEPVRV